MIWVLCFELFEEGGHALKESPHLFGCKTGALGFKHHFQSVADHQMAPHFDRTGATWAWWRQGASLRRCHDFPDTIE